MIEDQGDVATSQGCLGPPGLEKAGRSLLGASGRSTLL